MAALTSMTSRRVSATLVVLFLGTFTLGSAELMVVGVLGLVAHDLRVSEAAAGTLVTAYALGLAIGGPLLTVLTVRVARRVLLRASLAAYLVCTVLTATAPNLATMLVGRAVTGSLQGLFVAVAFTIATTIVPPERMGRAISAVLGGFAISTAVGVPLGTLLAVNLGWRGSFLADVAVGVLVLVATIAFVPSISHSAGTATREHLRYAFAPRVLAVLLLAAVLFIGQYAALTYIVPFLQHRTGIQGSVISAFLLAYGAATAAGALGGGTYADRNPGRTIIVCALTLVAAFAALLAVGTIPVLVAVVLIVWGLAGFGSVPSLQYRVITLSGPGGAIAASLPASAINAGIAIGSLLGAWAIDNRGPSGPVIVAVIVSALAVPIAIATRRSTPPVHRPAPTD